jgi:hypothetical protein
MTANEANENQDPDAAKHPRNPADRGQDRVRGPTPGDRRKDKGSPSLRAEIRPARAAVVQDRKNEDFARSFTARCCKAASKVS